ncbi:hypothetical protein B0T19DRAFT_295769 [Cercophora scortea]|uniref:Uncharacterized protein n=1 Tax=Cercophora scortea TaxID=314031 RepID=A0AAE0I3M8_9PEZI|nr:hypothetical protein B0T19DRAFT_295769 [Cercophora scortea]
MSFLTEVTARRVATFQLPRTLATSAPRAAFSSGVTLRKNPVDAAKDTLKTVDRAVSDKLVDGIDIGTTVASKIKGTAEDVANSNAASKAAELRGEAVGKASEVAGKAKGTAEEWTGKAKGAASEAAGKAQGTASEVAGRSKGTASDLAGQAKGAADTAAGKAKGAADTAAGKAKGAADQAQRNL